MPLRVQSGLVLFLILAVFLGGWQIAATPSTAAGPAMDPEYAKLLGAAAQQGQQTPMPRPSDIAARAWFDLRDPFYIHVGVDGPAASCAKVWLSASEPEGPST